VRENNLEVSYLGEGKISEPYDLFVFAINAEQTREKYIVRMKKVSGNYWNRPRKSINVTREMQNICR
jgi:hypothetical protein